MHETNLLKGAMLTSAPRSVLPCMMSVSSMEIVEEGEPTLSSLITEMKDSEKRITEGKKKFILQQLPLTDKTKQRFVEAYREFDE